MIDAQVAYDKLTGLGSGDAIADYFLAEYILGIPAAGWDCPIARYLRRETGVQPVVGVSQWYPSRDRALASSAVRYRDHSGPVADFVVGFDDQRYPKLITPLHRRPTSDA